MKKYCSLLLVIMIAVLVQSASAQTSARPSDSTMKHYARLANSTVDSDKTQLEAQLYQLLKSKEEKGWLTARRFFWQMKKMNTADSITKAAKERFPNGLVSRDAKVTTIYDEKDAVKKEKLYREWVKELPPQKFAADEQIVFDYARNDVAHAYAEADNVKKALEYANMTATPAWKGEGWAGIAPILKKNGHLKEAEDLYKKAIANSYKFMTTNRNDPGAGFAAIGYVGYNTSLAELLTEQKKYEEALPYIKAAHDSAKSVRGNVNATYAKLLIALGKDQEAFGVIDEAVKAGQATQEMKDQMKTLYVKVKGSNAGYDEYVAAVNKSLAEKIRKDMTKQMINLPAANFTLKDVDGNAVTLADLKGKVVVLDFWATWCGPCKRSFPAMKMAVERYKN